MILKNNHNNHIFFINTLENRTAYNSKEKVEIVHILFLFPLFIFVTILKLLLIRSMIPTLLKFANKQ